MAKGFIAQFLVKVGSTGLGKTKQDVDALGKSTENVARAHNVANKAAGDHFDTQAKGVIGTANSTKSFSKLAQTMNGGGGIVGAYATLAANVFALTAAFGALRAAAQVEQVTAGLEALGNRTGRSLGLAAESLREVTHGAISAEQAMRSTAQVFSAGFGSEQLERLGRVATDASFALGRNMTDAMDRLTRGVVKLEPELLDEMGIMTRLDEATRAYALQLGKSASALTATEKRQAFFNAVMTEGELKFGGLSEAAGNTRAFDQLAATFSDLTKTLLNFINTAALPLAALFSAAPAALFGGMLLFAGTIRKQLLPGLTDLSRGAIEASESLSKVAREQAATVAGLDPKSKNKQSDILKNLNKEIAAGTAGLDKQTQAYNISQKSVEKFNAELKTLNVTQAAGAKRAKFIESEIEVHESYQNALRKSINTEVQAVAQRKAGDSILAASQGQYGASLSLLNSASKDYYNSTLAAAKGNGVMAKSFAAVRTGAFAASVGVRALGAAFLNAIPIIGQIIFAIGLLVAGFKYIQNAMRSQAEKDYVKNMKELDTIIKSLDAKSRDYNKTLQSSAPAFLRQQQAMSAVSNITAELSEKLTEAIRLQEKMKKQQESAKDGRDMSFIQTAAIFGVSKAVSEMGAEAITSWWTGIEKGSKFIDFRSLSQEVTGSAGFKTFKELFESEIPLIARTAEASLGGMSLEEINAKPAAEQLRIFNRAAAETVNKLKEIGPAAEAVAQAYKEADSAASQFITSMGQNTVYDKMVEGLNGINNALIDQAKVAATAGLSLKDYAASLSGLGSSSSKFLSQGAQQVLSDYRVQDSVVQSLSAIPEDDLTAAQARQLVTAREQLAIRERGMVIVGQELDQLDSRFTQLQSEERLGKRQLELEQARLKAISSIYEVTAAGLRAQLEGEDRIRNLQSRSITLQRETNALILNNNQLSNEELLTLNRLQARREELFRLSQSTNETERETAARELGTLSELQKRQQSSAEAQANEINLSTQQLILDESSLTAAQRTTQEIERSVAIRASALRSQREAEQVMSEIAVMDAKSTRLLQGRASYIVDEINELKEANRQRRLGLDTELAIKREQLEASIASQRATGARAQTVAEQQAAQSQVNRYELELRQAELTRETQLAAINAQERLSILEKATFEARTDGITWQQESLALLEKEAGIRKDILDSETERYETELRLSLRRRGLEASPEQDAAIAIRAATQEYNLAVEQARLRRSMIDLEFALLDGQREILKEQLEDRKLALQMAGIAQSDSRYMMVEAALDNLGRMDLEPVRQMAQRAVEETLSASRASLESLIDPSVAINNPVNSMTSFIEGLSARVNAAEEASASLQRSQEREKAVIVETATAISEGVTEAIEPVVTPMQGITTKLTEIASYLATLVENVGSQLSASSPQEAIEQLGRDLQRTGLRVSEQSEFGGVTPGVHRGRGHAENRAIDVNIGTGNVEWNNPAMKARFDALDAELTQLGATVLWGPAEGHLNHLHVEFKAGFERQIEASQAIVRATEALPSSIAQSVAPIVAANDNSAISSDATSVEEITVVGQKAVEKPLKEARLGLDDYLAAARGAIDQYRTELQDLGPNGTTVLAIADGAVAMAASVGNAFEVMNNQKASAAQKFVATASVVSSAISSISSIISADSAARIAMIDQEIAAEQRRDGKSAESVAKIQSLEKKKDAQARKSFEINKKLMMAQAIISTATGMAQALTLGPILGPIMMGVIGALGAAQLAIIAGTSYQSTSSPAIQAASMPATLSIGKRGDSVDLAKNNPNAGGEIGYLRGQQGVGSNSGNYSVIGSAYGGALPRGYGNTAFVVGEHGPEIMTPDTPMTVRPMDAAQGGNTPQPVHFNINTLDASGVEEILLGQRGNIIGMLREAANASGQPFLEDVSTHVYTKPNVGRL